MSHYNLKAIDDLKLSSKNGQIVHNSECAFNHANDQRLQQLKALSMGNNDLVVFNGDELSTVNTSNFCAVSDNYLQSADQYIQSVASSELSVNAGALSVDLSSYLTSSQGDTNYVKVAEQYVQSVGSNLNVIDHELNVDLSAYTTTTELQNNYLQQGDQYINSVGSSVLNVSGQELTIDLSAYSTTSANDMAYVKVEDQYIQSVGSSELSVNANQLTIDLSNYLQTSSQYISSVSSSELSVNAGSLSVDLSAYETKNDLTNAVSTQNLSVEDANDASKTHSKVVKFQSMSNSNTSNEIHSIEVNSGKCVSVKAVLHVNCANYSGKSLYEAMYYLDGSNAAVYSDSVNASYIGNDAVSDALLVSVNAGYVKVNCVSSTALGLGKSFCEIEVSVF